MNIFKEILSVIEGIPGDIKKLFTTPEAEAAIQEAATLTVQAAPYVMEFADLFRNPVVAVVAAAYAKYAVPFATEIETATPAQLAADVENLIVILLQKNKASNTAVEVVETAVSLARSVVNAQK